LAREVTYKLYRGEYYWPSWRTVYTERDDLEYLHSSYYYRIRSHFGGEHSVAKPHVITLNLNQTSLLLNSDDNVSMALVTSLLEQLNSKGHESRIVLNVQSKAAGAVRVVFLFDAKAYNLARALH
jgi:hypothetical protein